jgi:CBS domain-containing protein
MRPKRGSESDNGEFQDPLKNYAEPEYADELERTLAEAEIGSMRIQPVMTVLPDTTVFQAISKMAEHDIGSIVIVDDQGRLLGIFSERDVMQRVADRFEQIKDQPISEVMTPAPVAAYSADSPGKAMNLMAVGGFRHVPVLDADDKVIGILGPRRVSEFVNALL